MSMSAYARLRAEQLPITAHHEAAHAVMYWNKGYTFRYVTIHSRYAVGQVALWRPRLMRSFDLAEIAAAGPVAELHYLGRQLNDEQILAEVDEEVFLAELENEPELSDRLSFGRALPAEMWLGSWRGTELMVTGYLWPAVLSVAEALLASRRALTYAEVSAIAEDALSDS